MGVWGKRSGKGARLIFWTTYHLGALPITFDTDTVRMNVVRTQGCQLRWVMIILIQNVLGFSLILSFGKKMIVSGLQLRDIPDAFSFLMALVMIFVCLASLHTFWKLDDIVSFINSCTKYYETFQDRYAKDRVIEFEDLKSSRIKRAYFFSLVSLCVIGVPMYLARCDLHVLAPILPVCTLRNTADDMGPNSTTTMNMDSSSWSTTHGSPEWIPFWALAQFFMMGWACSSFILYLDIGVAVIVFGLYIFAEMIIPEEQARTMSILRQDPTHWTHNYRCFQIINGGLNSCVGTVIMPTHLFFIMGITVISSYALLRLQLELFLNIALIIVLLVVVLYFAGLGSQGVRLLELSEALIQSKGETWSKDRVLLRVLRSLPVLKSNVGSFFYFTRGTLILMGEAIIDKTVALLLM